MPEGVITQGWNYVIAAYSLTGVVFIAYGWSLLARWKSAAGSEEIDR